MNFETFTLKEKPDYAGRMRHPVSTQSDPKRETR